MMKHTRATALGLTKERNSKSLQVICHTGTHQPPTIIDFDFSGVTGSSAILGNTIETEKMVEDMMLQPMGLCSDLNMMSSPASICRLFLSFKSFPDSSIPTVREMLGHCSTLDPQTLLSKASHCKTSDHSSSLKNRSHCCRDVVESSVELTRWNSRQKEGDEERRREIIGLTTHC
jgi:hypothetical protein